MAAAFAPVLVPPTETVAELRRLTEEALVEWTRLEWL